MGSTHSIVSLESLPASLRVISKCGLTADCLTVQTALDNLAMFLAMAPIPEDGQLTPRAIEAVRQTRSLLADHTASIEGPGGLFRYMEESAPHLTPDIDCLCRQHQQIDQCLAALEDDLNGGDSVPASVRRRMVQCSERLSELLARHRSAAEELAADASSA